MGATVSGVAMDGGRAIGLAGVRTDFTIVGSAYADDHDREKHGEDRDEHGIMEEIHEALSSLVILFVVCTRATCCFSGVPWHGLCSIGTGPKD